jgi:hypothetical protein
VAPLGEEMLERLDPTKDQWIFANGMSTNWTMAARRQVAVRARHAYSFARGSGDGGLLFLPHEEMLPSATPRDRSELATLAPPADGYGGVEELGAEFVGVSILDGATGERRSFRPTMGHCPLPRGASLDYRTQTLFVACSGNDTIVPFRPFDAVRPFDYEDGRRFHVRQIGAPFESAMGRVRVCAGPSDVAFDRVRQQIVVACERDGAIAVVPLAKKIWESKADIVRFARPSILPSDVDRGRALFFRAGDTRIAKDGRACASCHIEGLADGLVWSTPSGPRSPPVLAGRVQRSGPFGWNGQNRTLVSHITQTIHTNLQGTGLDSSDVTRLAAYVEWLPPPRGALAGERAARGEAIFEESGCASCHEGDLGTDGARHDVSSGGKFVTPPLLGLARSAPYYHDGRYSTLDDLLSRARGPMGAARNLPAEDRNALAAYLASH